MKRVPQRRRCDKIVIVRGKRRQCQNVAVQRYLGKWCATHAIGGRL